MVNFLTSFRVCSLVSLFLQSILYGIYLITSGSCAAALTRVNGRWRSRRELQWPFLLAGFFLLLNTTCGLCIQFYNCLDPIVRRGSGGSSIPSIFSHSTVIMVRYTPRFYYKSTLRDSLISPHNFSASRLWETSFSSTELSSYIGGTGVSLRHLSFYGLPL